MNSAWQKIKRFLIVIYLLVLHIFALIFIFNHFIAPYFQTDESYTAKVESPTEETPVPTIIPVPSIESETLPTIENVNSAVNSNQNINSNLNPNQNTNPNITSAASTDLIIPVLGIKAAQLTDTFSDARSDNRVHDAIDIMAAGGTPVVACADGEIAKFFDSKLGGTTIYQYSVDHKYVYYYAHLQRRADNIKEKDFVKQGMIIGYVGDTGNAGAGNYHLHFSIAILGDPKRYWEGTYINPFPLLKNAREAR